MKNRLRTFIVSFLYLLTLLCIPGYVFSQINDIDEGRLRIKKTGIDEVLSRKDKDTFTDQELKYIAGEDKEWNTFDDAIYHYFLVQHDAKGNVLKKTCLSAGEDTIPLTSDDMVQNYQIFEYAKDGRLEKEISFNNKGKKQYTVVYYYDENGKKNKTVRYNPKKEEIRSVEFHYDDKGLLSRDAEYVKKEIEKYHRFEYDNSGKLIRMTECHIDKNGKGPDGVWFTPDDVVSSTKEMIYDDDGQKIRENKYIAAGPDGKWFTDDDILQYYVLFEYEKA